VRYFFQNGSSHTEGTNEKIGLECFQIPSNARKAPYVWGYFIVEDNIKSSKLTTQAH